MKINYKIISGMFFVLVLLSFVSALDKLPTAKLNQEYTITQTCASCSYVNISVKNLNGFVLNNVGMNENGSGVWTYDYTPTENGRYDVIGKGDLSGTDTSFATYFEVTPSGFTGTLGFYILIFILSLGIILLGYYSEDAIIILLGSMGLAFVGLYLLFYGIDGMKDSVYTEGIAIIITGLASYLMFRGGSEFLN